MTYLERRFATRWRQQSGIRYAKEAPSGRSLEQILDELETEKAAGGT